MFRFAGLFLLALAVGCSKSSSPTVIADPPPVVPQPAPPPPPHKNEWSDLKDPVNGIMYKITKAAIIEASGGEAVHVEYEQIAKVTASCRIVIKVGKDVTTYRPERIMFSMKGQPIRFIPAGTFVGGIRGKVEVWAEQASGEIGDPKLLASERVEAKRAKTED